jgi:L-fuconolactonase
MTSIPRDTWLQLTKEEPLDPELPICDPHHHLWDHPDHIPDEQLYESHRHARHYLLNELLEDLAGGHNIIQTVFIECRSMYRKAGPPTLRPIGETEFVQGIAAQSASGQYGNTAVAAGIVGFADLTRGHDVAPVLEAQVAASRVRFRGIRFISTWHPHNAINSRVTASNVLSNPKFREGFAYLHKYNLSFDAWLYHTQLLELVNLANAFPATTIILDHIGGPLGIGPYAGKRDAVFQEWKQGIAALAECTNVVVKLGGIGMPLMGFGWHQRPAPPTSAELADSVAPYFIWCIDHFGVDRCMFESNFPVDKLSCSYSTLWNAFKRIAAEFSPSDQAALFHNTAAKVYKLPPT